MSAAGGGVTIKGAVLQVNGVLYACAPDHVWALDARDGHELWHYFWRTKGSTHIGCRGVGMWHNNIYVETPDDYLVSLDARTGKENWHVALASFEEQYFSTMAPIVVGNHIIVGTGNDLDMPGFLQSFDPETGKLQWKFYTVPMKAGDPGTGDVAEPRRRAARRRTGVDSRRLRSGDESVHLRHRKSDARATRASAARATTCSRVRSIAVDVDTGKMKWYFQTSPHDTHDWDSAQTPILVDGDDQRPAAQARLDRGAQRLLLHRRSRRPASTSSRASTARRRTGRKGIRENGSPDPNPEKEATIPGSLVSPVEGGVTNWQPSAYSPDTGLFYAQENNGFNFVYLTDPDPRGSMGLGGKLTVTGGRPAGTRSSRSIRRRARTCGVTRGPATAAADPACW